MYGVVHDSLVVALIGLGGAIIGALLTAVLQPLFQGIFTARANLVVRIRPSRHRLPRFLTQAIDEYRYNYHLNIKPNDQTKKQLAELLYSRGLYEVDIINNSKKSIDGVAIRTNSGTQLVADVESSSLPVATFFGSELEVGTVRPQSKVSLAIWSHSDTSSSKWESPAEHLLVTAREYDRLAVNVVSAEYLSAKYFLINRRLAWRAFWWLSALWWVYLLSSCSLVVLRTQMEQAETSAPERPLPPSVDALPSPDN